jgi:hypothetical protein
MLRGEHDELVCGRERARHARARGALRATISLREVSMFFTDVVWLLSAAKADR